MAKKQLLSLSSFIVNRREAAARIRAEINNISRFKDDFAPAIALANRVAKAAILDGEAYMSAEPEVWFRWDDSAECNLRVTIVLQNIESLKDGRVPHVLGVAESLGFEFNKTEDYASANYAERTFRSELQLGKVQIKLRVVADIKDGSESCRKVQVGTEIKEVAKYEIVCN